MGVKLIIKGADFSHNSIGKSFSLPQSNHLIAFYLGDNIVKNLVTDEEDATLHSTEGGVEQRNGSLYFAAQGGMANYVETPHVYLQRTGQSTSIIVRRVTGSGAKCAFNAFNGGSSHAVPALFHNTLYAAKDSKWANNALTYTTANVFRFVAFTAENLTDQSKTKCYESNNGELTKTLDLSSTVLYAIDEPIIFGGNPYNEYGSAGAVDIAAILHYDTILSDGELTEAYNYLKKLELNKFEIAVA